MSDKYLKILEMRRDGWKERKVKSDPATRQWTECVAHIQTYTQVIGLYKRLVLGEYPGRGVSEDE
jgi:hypothetical protein